MQQPLRTSSADSAADGIRKRVCKACDRCRLKKSKCDGSSPCSRCKADNAICVFGERKKSHDKVYPKGYVEMLEQQQGQLVSGLQEMYRRALKGNTWHTAPLAESNGNPLTHDLLAALDLLESKHDGSNEKEEFEENLSKLQQRLYDRGAGTMRRRASVSSESDQSHLGLAVSTPQDTPILNKPPIFKEEWGFSASPSPIAQSPLPRQRQSYPSAQQLPNHHQPSPLTQDPHLYQPDWTLNNINNPGAMMASRFAMQTPRVQHTLNDVEEMMINNSQMELYEQSMSEFNAFSQDPSQFASPFGGYQGYQPDHYPIPLDERDLDFNNFLKVEA